LKANHEKKSRKPLRLALFPVVACFSRHFALFLHPAHGVNRPPLRNVFALVHIQQAHEWHEYNPLSGTFVPVLYRVAKFNPMLFPRQI
jgi:hypothetical protein